MQRLILIACTALCLVALWPSERLAHAQPVTIGWRPPAGCSSGQVISWNGTTWVCGAAGSTYTAGDGLTLTGSDFDLTYTSDFTITADQLDLSTAVTAPGTVDVAGNFTSGDAAGDVFDHNGDLVKFGSNNGDGTTFINAYEIGFGYAVDADFDGVINAHGYQNLDTRFRNLVVKDGKGATACTFTGSTKTLNCVGGLQVNGTSVFLDSAITVSSNVLAKGGGGDTMADSLWSDNGTTTTYNTNKFSVVAASGNTTAAGTLDVTGLVTATAGGTTPANWTTTGTGDLVSADDLSVGDDSAIGDDATDLATVTGTLDSDAAITLVGDVRGKVLNVGSFSGATNNWAPTGYETATHFAITGTGAITLTGIQGGADGRIIVLTNMAGSGVADVTIDHESGSSTAANRFDMTVAASWILATGESATFIYNGSSQRWVHTFTRRFPSLFVSGSAQVNGAVTVQNTLSATGNTDIGNADSDMLEFQAVLKDKSGPPTLSSCGTSPTVTGGSNAFVITFGTGSPTACTATFSSGKTNSPACVATLRDPAEGVYISAASGSAITITARTGTTDLSSNVVDVICIGDG